VCPHKAARFLGLLRSDLAPRFLIDETMHPDELERRRLATKTVRSIDKFVRAHAAAPASAPARRPAVYCEGAARTSGWAAAACR
jgi:hypothetical protein